MSSISLKKFWLPYTKFAEQGTKVENSYPEHFYIQRSVLILYGAVHLLRNAKNRLFRSPPPFVKNFP